MAKKFASFNFGCRVNQAEIEEINSQMLKAGFSYSEAKPDIFIINSCAITSKAEREARQLIYSIKKNNPTVKIVLTGCAATYWKKLSLYKNLPIEILIDNSDKKNLVKLILKTLLPDSVFNQNNCTKIGQTSKFVKSGRIIIKIQDGCQRFCSYCIVPHLRGSPKSFLIKDIVNKANSLTNIREIILTAVNTEAFGYDTDEKLTQLINQLTKNTKIPRISFGSIHPWSINKDFINYYKKVLPLGRLVNFFHIPLQSGSDKILKLMKRDYTVSDFSWKINEIKNINPFALVATDVIVGFLDETDKNFEESLKFIQSNPIDKLHIFRFSNRQKTAADLMKKKLFEVPNAVKGKRAKLLADLGRKKYSRFLQMLADNHHQSSALFIDSFKNNHQQALLNNQVPVWIKSNKNLTAKINNVKITDFKSNFLFGKIN